MRYCRIHFRQQVIHHLKKAASLRFSDAEAFLASDCRSLLAHVLHFKKALNTAYAVPAAENRLPRLFPLVQTVLGHGDFTTAALQLALAECNLPSILPSEAAQFPLYVAAAQCIRLDEVLTSMLRDANERAAVPRLIRRLKRSRHPMVCLERSGLHSAGIAAVLSLLRKSNDSLLQPMEQWLAQRGASSEQITRQALARQHRFAEELRQAEECFAALSREDWLLAGEVADPLHLLLLEEPSGVYGRMTPASRLDLRLQIEAFSRRVHLPLEDIVDHALKLSRDAEKDTLEAYVGFWFQDAAGMRSLHQSLPTRRGRLYATLALRRQELLYVLELSFGLVTGFAFLQAYQPVFMLPLFTGTAGEIIRALLCRVPLPLLPQMDIHQLPEELRTLVVLPAMLQDSHEALRQVRRMEKLRYTFSETRVDILLLGDFADSKTIISSSDAAVMQAAASAVTALNDSCHLYLQRGRAWDANKHICCARGGERGAVDSICRLVSQGDCEDTFTYASTAPASFERRYAYILVLASDSMPTRGMLEKLLQTISHPLCSRYPAPDGWRGYSILSPEGCHAFKGTGLIQPVSYLEATDGLLYAAMEAGALCGELAGYAYVPDAIERHPAVDNSWGSLYQKTRNTWEMAPWQLPWVQTPSGFIRNPLKFFSRFRLREMLRASLVPVCRFGLMLWAIASGSWVLLLLALIAPELHDRPLGSSDWLDAIGRLALLPTQATLPFCAIIDLVRKKPATKAFALLEIWSQGIAATVMIAFGIAFHEMALPSISLGILFACFSLVHRYLES